MELKRRNLTAQKSAGRIRNDLTAEIESSTTTCKNMSEHVTVNMTDMTIPLLEISTFETWWWHCFKNQLPNLAKKENSLQSFDAFITWNILTQHYKLGGNCCIMVEGSDNLNKEKSRDLRKPVWELMVEKYWKRRIVQLRRYLDWHNGCWSRSPLGLPMKRSLSYEESRDLLLYVELRKDNPCLHIQDSNQDLDLNS